VQREPDRARRARDARARARARRGRDAAVANQRPASPPRAGEGAGRARRRNAHGVYSALRVSELCCPTYGSAPCLLGAPASGCRLLCLKFARWVLHYSALARVLASATTRRASALSFSRTDCARRRLAARDIAFRAARGSAAGRVSSQPPSLQGEGATLEFAQRRAAALLLPSPWTRRPRSALPQGRVAAGRATELSPQRRDLRRLRDDARELVADRLGAGVVWGEPYPSPARRCGERARALLELARRSPRWPRPDGSGLLEIHAPPTAAFSARGRALPNAGPGLGEPRVRGARNAPTIAASLGGPWLSAVIAPCCRSIR